MDLLRAIRRKFKVDREVLLGFQPGDVVLVRSKSPLAAIISYVGNKCDDDIVYYTHAAMVYDEDTVFQIMWDVEKTPLLKFFQAHPDYRIIRYRDLTVEQLAAIRKEADKLLKTKYSVYRLFACLFDQVCGTRWFTREIDSERRQVCSSLIAYVYYTATGKEFNGIEWNSCTPDDIDDETYNPDSPFAVVVTSVQHEEDRMKKMQLRMACKRSIRK
jgi:hypothetical protein